MSHFDPWDTYWDPASEGDILCLEGIEQGVPWEAMIMWAGGSWSRVVGITVGHGPVLMNMRTAQADRKSMRMSVGPITGPAIGGIPDGMTAHIAGIVERDRADLDLTQRVAAVFRDVDNWGLNRDAVPKTLGGRDFDVIRKPSGDLDETDIAAGLYQLFADLGRRSPTKDVATALRISRATAGRRIEDARDRGLLPPARQGTITTRGIR